MGVNTNYEAEDITPDPISLLESNRNLGYSIEEAVADLVDNSISAKAKNIFYELYWNEGIPYFTLKDDGLGMSNKDKELVDSFKLGSKNPLAERDPKDLGRFGFGMKTASLSQARCLTVISKKETFSTLARSLDLDFITNSNSGWKLKFPDEKLIKNQIEFLNSVSSGTVIRWDNWDRAPKLKSDFDELNIIIRNYLSVCFHRFIEKGLKIYCNDILIMPCSPIPAGEGAVCFSTVSLSENSEATQSSYILQHPKYWSENYDNSFGINSFKLFEGFERQQGIYIYRGGRLLTPKGGWMGLINEGNAAKLARVIIDYPNNADHLWSLDITKTNSSIPYEFKKSIKDLILASKSESQLKINRGFRQISNSISNRNNNIIWVEHSDTDFNGLKYKIDPNHPLFKYFISENKISEKDLKTLLITISENLPVSKIIQNNDDDPFKHDRGIRNEKLTQGEIELAVKIFEFKCREMPASTAFQWMLNLEPYCYYETQLKDLLKEKLK